MPPAHFALCLLACIAYPGVTHAIYEDCKNPPPVDHGRAELFESPLINTAIYSCQEGYALQGSSELICNVETEEWQADPPSCVKVKGNSGSQAKLKKKLLSIPEEPDVPADLVPRLDLSCIQANVQAPEIGYGGVAKYERRRRGEKVFLVAYYACNQQYDFEHVHVNALYCSSGQWVGELPSCLPRKDYIDYDADDYDEYETIENEPADPELESGSQVADPVAPPPPPPPVDKPQQQKEDAEDDEEDEDEDDQDDEFALEPEIVKPQPDPQPEPEVELVVPQEPQLLPQPDPEPKAEVETLMETEEVAKLLPETDMESELERQPEPEAAPEPELQPQPEAAPESKPEVEPEPEPETETQPEPEPQPQPQPEPEPEQKQELQPETKVQTEETTAPAPVTDINIVVEPTSDPYTPRLLDESCGEDRGGCAHKCERLLFPGENEPRLKCSCHDGYTLDPEDYASCHDIDECLESNGGCAQICNNLPGGYECACSEGYRVSGENGSCVDIDECADPELATECADGCENTPGSYRCVAVLNTKEEAVQESQEADRDNEVQPERTPASSCNPGFALAAGGTECQDINECDIVVEDNDDADQVPHRVCQQICENTIGSYRCSCREGYRLSEDGSSCAPDRCADLDNPQLNRTRCAHECQDRQGGGYVCLCPAGYRLAADLHSCEVLETVCSRQRGHERCLPGSCLPSEDNSTFSCLCPPGYVSDVFSCQDLDECALGTHKCSHNCFNTAGGYQCLCPHGMTLQEPDGHACVAPDPCAFNNNGCEQLCLSAEGGACTCSKGYALSGDGKSCHDVDECQVNNGGCQQLCRNQPGAYECVCAAGYELLRVDGLDGYCFDIDECATSRHSCGPSMRCENLNGSYTCLCEPGYALGISSASASDSDSDSPPSASLSASASAASPACLDIDECSMSNANCSHFCINLPGSFQCACPLGFGLAADGRRCQDHDECQLNNGGCAQLCLNQPGGFACACLAGFQLAPDGFGCLDIDECSVDFGNCSSICVNLLGGHACACERGYELSADGRSCQDVDECAGLLSGGCTHECINKIGSYECGCPLGYLLQEDERSCRPALVGCPPGTRQSELGCEPIECSSGQLLGSDGRCVDIDECQVNNGGCSHECVKTDSSYKCACPAGHQLAANGRDCDDVDECAASNGGCEGVCINEPGSFRCACAPGKRLSFDGRSCYAVPALEPRVAPLPVPTPAPTPAPAPASVMPVRPLPTLRPLASPRPYGPTISSLSPPVRPALPQRPSLPTLPSLPSLASLPALPAVPASRNYPGFQVQDQCVRFQAPNNGVAHCNKYRHKRKLFYTTRCKVSCNAGYQLLGSDIRTCGASGQWEGQENKCVRLSKRPVWTSPSLSRPKGFSNGGCPALPAPRNGVLTPASCTQGASSFGSICRLQCNMGYVPVGGMLTTCFKGWTLGSVLECKRFATNGLEPEFGSRIQAPWQQPKPLFSQQAAIQRAAIQRAVPVQVAKPYLRCPESVVILLRPGQSKAHVILQRPATNIDFRHVVAFPPWAKQLQAHLPAGIHKVIYRAHDPATAQSVGCQTTINIKQAATAVSAQFPYFPLYQPAGGPSFGSAAMLDFRSPSFPQFSVAPKRFESLVDASPQAPRSERLIEEKPAPRAAESTRIDLGSSSSHFCPPSFEVQLKENQNLRSVVWEEPRFEGKLLKIYKSSFPGALFRQGNHEIKYEATTTDGRNLYCVFHIRVKPADPSAAPTAAGIGYPDLPAAPAALTQTTPRSLFAGHESYVVCPGKEPVKVTSSQSVNLPVGCTLKNVRPQASSQSQPKRGLLTSLWRQYNNF